MAYKLLHRHGEAGPKGNTKSYLQFGNFKSKREARIYAKSRNFDGYRIAPKEQVKATKYKGLYYVKKSSGTRAKARSSGGSYFSPRCSI